MGHRDYKATEVYADLAPDPSQGAGWAERAFGAASYDKSRPDRRLVDRLIGSGDENL